MEGYVNSSTDLLDRLQGSNSGLLEYLESGDPPLAAPVPLSKDLHRDDDSRDDGWLGSSLLKKGAGVSSTCSVPVFGFGGSKVVTVTVGEELTITKTEHRIFMAVFILLGSSALFFWNSILNVLFTVVVALYPDDPSITDSITASYSTVACIVALILSIVGAQRVLYNVIGGIWLALMSILFPIVCKYCPGTLGVVLLHLVAMGAGCAEMLFQCSGYAFAVILPRNYAKHLSLGYGLCGILSFCLWMLSSQVLFPFNLYTNTENMDTTDMVLPALSFHFSICATVNIVSVVCFLYLHSFPVVAKSVALSRLKHHPNVPVTPLSARNEPIENDVRSSSVKPKETSNVSARVSQSSPLSGYAQEDITRGAGAHPSNYMPATSSTATSLTGLKGDHHSSSGGRDFRRGFSKYIWIFTQTWEMQLGMAYLMFITMAAYPNIGPYGWDLSDTTQTDILTGVEQTCDFLGRYIPLLSCAIGWVMISPRVLSYLNLFRVILFVLFVMVRYYPHVQILGNYGFQVVLIIALALSNGWYASLFMVYAPDNVSRLNDKARASSLCVCLLVAAIAIGLWFAKIFQ